MSAEHSRLDEFVRRKIKAVLAVIKSGWLKKEFVTQFRLAIPVVRSTSGTFLNVCSEYTVEQYDLTLKVSWISAT